MKINSDYLKNNWIKVMLVESNTDNLKSLETCYKEELSRFHDMGPHFFIAEVDGKIFISFDGVNIIGSTSRVDKIDINPDWDDVVISYCDGYNFGNYHIKVQNLINVKTKSGSYYRFMQVDEEIIEKKRTIGWHI
jgi:hypothetical protein